MFRGGCLGWEIKFAKWNWEETLLALLGRLIELGLRPLLKITSRREPAPPEAWQTSVDLQAACPSVIRYGIFVDR